MQIGLTFELRSDFTERGYTLEEAAEFDCEESIGALEETLRLLGHMTERIGDLHRLASALVQGARWDLVFNLAEGEYGFGREAQVPALLEAHGIPYTFSDPLVCALTLHKGMTKRVLRALGLPTPDFVEVHDPADLEGITLPFPLFVKPLAEGSSKGITADSRVATVAQTQRIVRRLLRRFPAGVLVETFLPGRELTVGILGTGAGARAVAVLEVFLLEGADGDAYNFANKWLWQGRTRFALTDEVTAREARALALEAWRGLGCRDCGRVDLRADAKGNFQILEVNPVAGLHPTDSNLPMMCALVGISYTELVAQIIDSAFERSRELAAQFTSFQRGSVQ